MTALDEILNEIGKKLDGVWILAVSDFDGMLIGSWQSPDNKLNPEMLSGQFVRVLRSLETMTSDMSSDLPAAISKPGVPNPFALDDMVISTGFSYVMVKPMCNNSCYLLVDSSKKVPLGLIRMAATNYVPRLEKCLPS